MSDGLDRRFLLAGVLKEQQFRLYRFDRSGTVGYHPIRINEKSAMLRFVRMLCFLCTADTVALGFDPMVEGIPIPRIPFSCGRRRTSTGLPGSFVGHDPLRHHEHDPQSQGGSRTRHVGVRDNYWYTGLPDKRTAGILKDAWTDSYTSDEVKMLGIIRSKDPNRYVAVPVAANYVHVYWADGAFRPREPRANWISRHMRIFCKGERRPLLKYRSFSELVSVLRDALLGLKHLRDHHSILHRHLSTGNIMIDEDESRGYLIDFDIGCLLEQKDLPTRLGGTRELMSINALHVVNGDYRHRLSDDVESVFYVLLKIILRGLGPNGQSCGSPKRIPAIDLMKWREGDMELSGDRKLSDMLLNFDIVKHELPFDEFQSIRILLEQFHEAIFPRPKGYDSRVYASYVAIDRVISIFNKFSLQLPLLERLQAEGKLQELYERNLAQCMTADDLARALEQLSIQEASQ